MSTATELRKLSETLQLPILDSLEGAVPQPDFVRQIPISSARNFRILAVERGGTTSLAITDLTGWRNCDLIARLLDLPAKPILVTDDVLSKAINAAYSENQSGAQQVLDTIATGNTDAKSILKSLSSEDLLASDGKAPIIRLVNQLLFDAVIAGASDIHIQPYEDCVWVRQRIDGVLFDVFEIPKAIQEEVLTRIKVLGKMNIAEKRLPQDGRATVQLGERTVDLRIASLPTSHNERIVIRLLDKSARLYTLGELGMKAETLARFRSLIVRDHGLILVTGPTGSGKSTTLYGALQEIDSKELNILTLEDPIEYQLHGISQTQINEKKGMTFASGMRNVLRQDPDIIMVGEIRDTDTANMAIQASLTGHLVFSTLHTNDAASAITRLLDLGVEPYLVSSSVIAALAQRLVRRLCLKCRQPAMESTRTSTNSVPKNTYEPIGCSECRQTGFRGRVGIYELLTLTDEIRDLVQRRASASQIREVAIAHGMTLLASDGLSKVAQGETTVAEVLRVANIEFDA